jgi:formaldehyde-activating enzyme involved in methanogenesis
VLTLAACDPAATVGRVQEAAARSVLVSVAESVVPASQAETAAFCLVTHATPAEVEGLARDVGTRPGTTTYATARAIAARPQAQVCLRERGVAPLRL